MNSIRIWSLTVLSLGFLPLFARTMTVASTNDTSVTLSFGEADGKAYTLCVAYGAADGGADKHAWASFTNGVATIGATDTTYTCTIPQEALKIGAYYRFFLLQTDNLPYTQELTYIESKQTNSQTQYINTGVNGDPGIRVESDLSITTSADTTMIGSKKSSVRFFPIHVNGYSKWSMGYNGFHAGTAVVTTGKKVHAIGELTNGKQSLTIDGVTSYSGTEGSYTTGLPMFIFACNIDGSAKQASKIRVYNLDIYKDGTLVRSFIPVKRKTGYGGMCDRLTGGDYGNAGSGSFTLGAAPADEANRRGLIKATSETLQAPVVTVAATDVLLTWPWQQNVYTNRFTIMCETKMAMTDLQLQYGTDYAQTATMTGEQDPAGTYIYKARVTVNNAEGTEIPYRLALAGIPLSGEGTNSTAGVVRLWKASENDFTCAIWGDNQQGARAYDWDVDKFAYLKGLFNHMLARDVDFGICTGDMASSANYTTEIRPCNLDTTDAIFGRVKPYYIAWGNHDTAYPNNKPYFETSGIDDPDYLSSTCGNAYLYRGNTLLILLDDQLCQKEATKTWLANLLATPRAQAAAFRLVYHHQPIYTEVSGSEISFLRQTFVDGNVDVVFGGHMHGYERIVKDGVTYIINGCAGYLDHNITLRRNYGDDSFVGGHIDLPYLWARQESASVNNVLGAAEPARMGMVTGYAELAVKNNRLFYQQHAFNADGSYIGVCDTFALDSKTAAPAAVTPTADPTCADPSTFAQFTASPVTNAKWKEFADAVGLAFTYADGQANAPVVNVSKTDITRFLAWLNGSTGTYRLPTVAELETAFAGQLRRTVSEWTSTVDPATGWCRILGSPAKARTGVYERVADRPALMTADCHADYVGFRLATGTAPSDPADPFAAPLAALAQIAEPAAVYKWQEGALVDISSEWTADGDAMLTYDVPVIFTGSGDLSFAKSATFAGGCALPNASSLTLTGALAIGTRLAFGHLSGAGTSELTGFILNGSTLALDGVTFVGSCVQFRSGDRTLRLAGANDFSSAALNFGASSVTNLVAATPGTAATLRARSARQYTENTSYNFGISPDVTVMLAEAFQFAQAHYWIDGALDVASVSMTGNNGPFFWGAGTLTTGEFAMYQNSWVRWGVSNIVFTSGRPFRTNLAGANRDRFQIEGDGVRVRATEDWTMPDHDQWNVPIEVSTDCLRTATPRLIVDTLDPDGTTAHTVTLAPNQVFATGWGITKEHAGTLILKGAFNQTAETRVTGGTLQLPDGAAHTNAAICVAAEGTLALSGTVVTKDVVFTDGTLALSAPATFVGEMSGAKTVTQTAEGVLTLAVGTVLKGAVTLADGTSSFAIRVTGVTEPGDYRVLEGSGLAANQVTFASDATLPATTFVDAEGVVYLRVIATGAGKTAYWTGSGTAGDITDPANWQVYDNAGAALANAVPDAETSVYLGGAPISFFLTAAPSWGAVHVAGSARLATDLDWSLLGNVTCATDAVLDLLGHTLSATAYDLPPEVTDSTTNAPGTLCIVVATGATITNTSVRLTGNAQFVKDGAGTLVVAMKNQTYRGGTEVVAGKLTTPVSGSKATTWAPYAAFQFGVHQSKITVRAGATFDLAGNYAFNCLDFVLDGGTLASTGCDMTQTTWGGLGDVALTADSVLQLDQSVVQNGTTTVDLSGHTLDVRLATDKYWFLGWMTFTNGTVKVTQNGTDATSGRFQTFGPVTGTTANFDLNCYLEIKSDLSARDFLCRHEGGWGWSNADNKIAVYGTFKPVSDYFCNVELQNGATLDLSDKTKVWSTASGDISRSQSYTMTVAAGATVTAKVAGRTFTTGEQVVSWATQPNATWQWDDASAAAGVEAHAAPYGLYWGCDTARAPTIVHWSGAVGTDMTDTANWVATNYCGELVTRLPGAGSTVYLTGSCAPTAANTTFADLAAVVCDDVHLAADADWRAFGTAPLSGDINVNGHTLRVAGLNGTARITDRPLSVDGYEPLAWIASNGSNYIDSGVKGNVGVSADAQVMCLNSGNMDACILGSRTGSTRFIPMWNVNTAPGMGYNEFIGGKNYGGSAYETFNRDVRYGVVSHLCDGRQTEYLDGVLKCQAAKTGSIQTGLNMWIFACNNGGAVGWPINARLYGMRIYENDVLVRSFVPARRTSDSAAGLYDTKNGAFYANATTNAFTAGAVVTATPGTRGELWVDVAAGTTNVNASVVLDGSLKLVKTGRGVYRTDVAMQAYTGGTSVAGGLFLLNATNAMDAQPLGVDAPQVVIDDLERNYRGRETVLAWTDASVWTNEVTGLTWSLSSLTREHGFWATADADSVKIARDLLIIIR